ncbi:MAG: YihY/virulence factor BrkB family protein [Gammaproteobacteria bacterium]
MPYLLNRNIAALRSLVWDDDLRELAGARRIMVFVLRVFHMLLRELLGGQLNLRAMSLVYTTLLSLVPLLAVSFSVLKGFGYHQRLEHYLFNFMLEPLGPSGAEVTGVIIGFVDNMKVGMLGSVGFALLIYTVIALVQKIEAAFNFVWQIERLRPMAQRFSNYLSVITIGPVLIFSAVGFTATILDTEIAQKLASVELLGTLFVYLGWLVPYILVCLAFTFIYVIMPNTRVEFRAALVGGVIAGVLWKVTGWGFATFIVSSARYAAIYSSFAILILLLIWMYLSWLILLVGSQITYFVQNPKFMTLHPVRFVLSNRLREQLALQLMYLVGYHHFHDKPPWRLEQLIEYLGLPDEPVSRILRVLVDAGYLVELQDEDSLVYLPQHDLGTIRLAELLDAVRIAGESRYLSSAQMSTEDAVNQLMAALGQALHDGLQQRTLRDVVGPINAGLEPPVPAGDPGYSSIPSAE